MYILLILKIHIFNQKIFLLHCKYYRFREGVHNLLIIHTQSAFEWVLPEFNSEYAARNHR